MVEKQFTAKMKGIYLLEKQPDDDFVAKVKEFSVEKAHEYLLSKHRPPKISKIKRVHRELRHFNLWIWNTV